MRVNYIRNPYFDDHFDLKNPNHLVGKTLYLACSSNNDTLSRTLQLIGLELYEKHDKAKELIEKFSSNNEPVIKEALKLLPEDNEIRQLAEKLPNEDQDIEKILENKVKEAERVCYEKDISEICKAFEQWGKIRMEELTKQQERYNIAQRITNIEEAKAKLQEKELKLWYVFFLLIFTD